MSPLSRWRLPLRLARRDALRHRARSALVLVMIALPVLAVTAADVLMQTATVSGAESVDRRMGAAEARITVTDGVDEVLQPPDPDEGFPILNGDESSSAPAAEQISSLLDGARLVEVRQGEVQVRTELGRASAEALEVDLRDPVADGLVDPVSGRLPHDAGEVVVNRALLDKGYAVGDHLDLGSGAGPRIVGVAESATVRDFPAAFGALDALGLETAGSREWLVDGGPVSWATVRQLNDLGALVASRAVIQDPPPESEWPEEVRQGDGDSTTLAVLALIAVMALIEVVLLAGPAFAVTARKQQRSLALLAATGGTPRESRRVVVASAVVLGTAAAVLGVGLGIALARLVQPLVESRSATWFGPFEVPWLHLAGVAGFGMLSAFLAAVVPAHLASRQDVVAVLAGRRGDRAPSLRSPLLGLVLLAAGVAGSVVGATGGGEFVIALSAVPVVLGMVLLVPVVLSGLARLSGRLPLVLRYAVRDADRHRTRTVPAVAAVAATVAGVVALGIGLTSDEKQNRETYTASLPDGMGLVTVYDPAVAWDTVQAAVGRVLPRADLVQLVGLADGADWVEVTDASFQLPTSGSSLGANILVSDGPLPVGLLGVDDADRARAEGALGEGQAVVFVPDGVDQETARVTLRRTTYDPESGEEIGSTSTPVRAALVRVDDDWLGPQAVLSTGVAEAIGDRPEVVALAVTGTEITEDDEDAVNEVLGGISLSAGIYVERGYVLDDETVIAQLVLVLLGAVLMLGGTLTATFLALSDARPDLATLAAVGAAPRTRRGVAAAYAVVVGGVGAVLGAVVGFVPGIAVTWPLTSQTSDICVVVGKGGCAPASGPFLDVPWLMVLGLVVLLPALTALVVGLATRSRLPLVARLD